MHSARCAVVAQLARSVCLEAATISASQRFVVAQAHGLRGFGCRHASIMSDSSRLRTRPSGRRGHRPFGRSRTGTAGRAGPGAFGRRLASAICRIVKARVDGACCRAMHTRRSSFPIAPQVSDIPAATAHAAGREPDRLHARRDPRRRAAAAAGDRRRGRRARRHRVGRVHRPPRSRAIGRASGRACPASSRPCRSRKAAWSARDSCSFSSTTVRSRPRSIGCAPSSRRRRPRVIAPPPSCGAPTGSRPRTRCRSKNASGAPAPPPKRRRSRRRRRRAARRRARPRVHHGRLADRRPRRAARSSRAAISCRAARAKPRC